ncbi:MAG: TonB-dependent receptor [Aestuariibacter sp.]
MSTSNTATSIFRPNKIALALAALASASCIANAQENDNQAPDAEAKQKDYYEQILVTGTASGTAVRKVDASYASTSLGAEDIKRLAPKSTADLFKAVPGVWAESSGGVSGANVFVRGFPGGGDAPFLTVQLQGVPVFQPPTLSFLENSTLFRIDETISFMDGLRGGPNSVVSNGQPGLTTNFILKEGSEATEGLVKYTTSSYDLQRVDAVLSGEISDDLYYMIGGYAQQSTGTRDAGFNSEKGNQFTINITKELSNGKLNFFTRITDDHGQWYLPVPIIEGVGNDYNQLGTLNRQATIQFGPDNIERAYDFGDGRGWDGSISGGSINLELGDGWTFVDRFALTKGDANTLGLVPNGNIRTIAELPDADTSEEDPDYPSRRYRDANNNLVPITGSVTGETYGDNTVIQQIGYWAVFKEIEAFTNDLALTKEAGNLKATIGLYTSDYSSKDWWSLGNQSYHVVTQGGDSLNGIYCNDFDDSCGWNYDIDSTGDGKTQALYVALDYQFTELLSGDLGLRRENHQIEYTVDESLDGTIDKAVQYDESDIAWTAGLNYQFERDMGVFLRLSQGSKMPYFDDFRDNFTTWQEGSDLIQDVLQYELGFKMARENFNIYATGFFSRADDVSVLVPGQGATNGENEAYGIEMDAAWFNDSGFSVTLNSTLQKTEITKSTIPSRIGNEAKRQPDWQVRLTPNYEFEMGNYFANVYGTLSAVSSRWSDDDNLVELPGYEKLDVGVNVMSENGLKFELSIQNVTDTDGQTEGDPRIAQASNARYILPRTATFSVSYEFY